MFGRIKATTISIIALTQPVWWWQCSAVTETRTAPSFRRSGPQRIGKEARVSSVSQSDFLEERLLHGFCEARKSSVFSIKNAAISFVSLQVFDPSVRSNPVQLEFFGSVAGAALMAGGRFKPCYLPFLERRSFRTWSRSHRTCHTEVSNKERNVKTHDVDEG